LSRLGVECRVSGGWVIMGDGPHAPNEASDRYRGEAGENYFAWQTGIGGAGAILNRDKFAPFVRDGACVVDFGCGGGALLAALPATRRIGIEPNPSAREEASARGIEVVASADELADGVADVVISNHALEHTLSPYHELVGIRRILGSEGRLVLWLPLDDWRTQKNAFLDDVNGHLYAWTPLLLRNLLEDAGYSVMLCRVVTAAWHPRFVKAKSVLPAVLFRLLTWGLAVGKRRRQIMVIAEARAANEVPSSGA
jgi:SAM-dependent methyltransferase